RCKARHAVTLGMRCFGAPVLGPHTSPLYLTSQIRSLHYHHYFPFLFVPQS
ncbi:hypothetical protein BJV78DRAFT_1242757, partial [Lactifluus subvellereus]